MPSAFTVRFSFRYPSPFLLTRGRVARQPNSQGRDNLSPPPPQCRLYDAAVTWTVIGRRFDHHDERVPTTMPPFDSSIPRNLNPHTPGVTASWLAHVAGVSTECIRQRRLRSDSSDPDATTALADLDPLTAATWARARPKRGSLPFWCRLAIAELRAQGVAYADLAKLFGCSRTTVWRALRRPGSDYCVLSGRRLLTSGQRAALRLNA